LSKWAFKAIRQGYPEYDRWLEAVLTRADAYNNKEFTSPLPYSEVRATAKSIAKFTHKNFSAEGFSAWQARQGAKGGRKSKRPTQSGSKVE
ncbi:primase C-terminal domain-containing protein, partial [Psychrobacter sp. CAL346-MNA-CIBAN-0220]